MQHIYSSTSTHDNFTQVLFSAEIRETITDGLTRRLNQIPRCLRRGALIILTLFFSSSFVQAATYYSIATGNWSNSGGTVWSLTSGGAAVAAGVYPVAGDVVTIERGFTVTVDVASACSSVQLGQAGTGTAGTLTFSNSSTLTVSGAVWVGNDISGSPGLITFTSGSTLIAGSLRLGGTVTGTIGTLTMTNGGTLSLGGAITIGTGTATWTPGTGKVIFTGNNTLPATVFTTFNNLEINSGTTTTGANITAIASLTVGTNGTFATAATHTITATNILVNGTYTNTSTGTLAVTNLTVNGTWNHNTSSATLPKGSTTTTWAAASNLNITGSYTAATVFLNFMGQSFGHVTFNPTSMTNTVALVGAAGTATIKGNFTISNTGTNTLYMRITGSTYAFNGIIDIYGNFSMAAGIFDMHNGGGTATNETINLKGNFTLSGTSVFTQTTTPSGSTVNFNFTGTAIQTVNISTAASITSQATTSTCAIQFAVASGAVIDMGTSVLTGTNNTSFTLGSGAGIITANTGGLAASGASGSIQVAGTRAFNALANYKYNGTANQVTGTGLTAAASVVFDNSNSSLVTLSNAFAVSGNMNITSQAKVSLNGYNSTANTLTFAGAAQVAGTWGSTSSAATNKNDTYFGATAGVITVSTGTLPGCSINLTSAANTDNQSFCPGSPITNITYATTTATGATVTGLPAGVTGSWASNVVTISGTPSVSGLYPYLITLTGGGCTSTATGKMSNTASLSYASPNTFPTGVPITPLNPTVSGSVTGYAISPALPSGLSFSTSTGVISGTPTVSILSATYTVTATFACGENLTFGVVIAVGSNRYAVNASSAAWNVTSTWAATSGGTSGVSVPAAGDSVFIAEASTARTVTIPSGFAAVCGSLTIGTNSTATPSTAGVLTFTDAGSTLTVGGGIIINKPNTNTITCAINLGAGTLTVNGNVELSHVQTANNTASRVSQINISTGTMTVAGNLTFAATAAAQSQIIFSSTGTLNIAGNFILAGNLGTLTPSTGTVNFNGTTAAQTIPIGVSSVTYYNLTINNTHANGATLSAAVTAANVTGNISVGNPTSGSLFKTGNFAVTFGNAKTLTVVAGSTMNAGTSVVSFGTTGNATINGKFQTANVIGFSGSATTAINSNNTPTITLGGSSTIEYNSAVGQAVTARTYNNLSLSNSGNKTILTGTTVNSNFSISGTAKGLLNNGGTSTALTITLGGVNQSTGSWGSSGSSATNKNDTWFVAANTGIINVNTSCTAGTWLGTFSTDWNDAGNWCGAVPSATTDVTIPSGPANQPVIGAAGGLCRNITINNSASLTISGSNTLAVYGNWTNNGTFTANTSTVDFTGSGAGSIGAGNFNNITFSGAGTKTATGILSIAGDVSITGNFTAGNFMHTVGGDWTKSGSFTATGSTINFNSSSMAQSIGASNFDNVTFSNAGTKTAAGALAIVGTMTISTNFSAGSYTHTLQGDWTNNGTFTANTSTISFNGASPQNINGSSSSVFYILTQSGTGGTTLALATSVSGTLTLTTGKITIGNNNLTVASTGSISGGSATSYVKTSGYGRLKQTVPGEGGLRNYPVGNIAYNPMIVQYNDVSTPENFSIRVEDGAIGNTNSTKTVNRKWYLIEDAAGTANLTLSATYNSGVPAGEEGSNFDKNSSPQFAYFDGTSWAYRPATTSTGSGTVTFTANGSAPDFTNTLGYFVLGSGDAFNATKLAVTNINPANPTIGLANTAITVQSRNSQSIPTMVATATGFELTCAGTTMTPTTTSATISQYAYQTTVSGVQFTESTWDISNHHYDNDATITATVTAGETLTAGASAPFNVLLGTIYEPLNSANWSTVAWQKSTDGGSTWTSTTTPSSSLAETDIIRIPGTITLTANVTASFYSMLVYGTLDISSGALTLNHATNDVDYNIYVTGTLKNSGGTLTNSNPSYPIRIAGGTFWHNMDGGSIPVCTWSTLGSTLSTCKVSGITSTALTSGLNQTFENFTWDNAGQTATQTLTADMTVNGALTLTNGKITTGSYYVIVGLNGTATNSTGAGWISGNLRRYVASTVTTGDFPVGDANYRAPFSIACTGTPSGNGYLNVSTTAAKPPAASGLNQSKYINRKWTISNNGVSGITLYKPACTFADGDEVGPPTEASLRLRKLTAGTWYTTDGAAAGNTISPTTSLSTAGLYAASDFYAGEDDCSSINAVWLGSTSTDWNVTTNWCSGSVPTAATDVIIPSATRQPVIGSSGGTCKNITIESGATLTLSGAYTLDVKGNWTNSGTFTAGTGTVSFTGTSAQTISGVTAFENLTINNTATIGPGNSRVTLISEGITVNGILNLQSANASPTQGTLHTGTFTLSMLSESATVTGTGDLTGIVRRTHTFTPNIQYQFGSQYTTLNFLGSGTRPGQISCKIVIGSALTGKTNAVQRYYSFAHAGTSYTDKVTVNLRYLTGELNGNTDTKLVLWDRHLAGTVEEHGKTNNSTANYWVGLSGLTVNYLIRTSLDDRLFGLADYSAEKNTWLGIADAEQTRWDVVANWSAGHVPLATEDVLIPAGKGYYPILTLPVEIQSLEIESGATFSAGSYDLTINGYTGAWQNNGTFDPGTGTLNLTHGNLSHIVSVSGSGVNQFHNLNIAANTFIKPGTGFYMKISGYVVAQLTSIVDLSAIGTSVEYNGASQTIVDPSHSGYIGYYNIIISGTGTSTLYDGTLDIAGNFTSNGTLDLTGSTVSFIGETGQTISGTITFNNLTVTNPAGVTALNNLTVNGELGLPAANPSASKGSLEMGSYTLSLGVNSTVTGTGDVTGTVKRSHVFVNDYFYAYSSANHGVTFTGVPDQTGNPLELYINTAMGTVLDWSGCTASPTITNPAKRVYTIWQSGTWYTTKGFFRAHFLPSEIPSGVDLSTLSIWKKATTETSPYCDVAELGKSNIDLVNYYVSIGNIPISIFPTTQGPRQITLAPTATSFLTWAGIADNVMSKSENWSPAYSPSSSFGLIIPDKNTTAYSPQLSGTVTCRSLRIESNGILNSTGASNLVLTGTGLVWTGEQGAIFTYGSSTVTINCSESSKQSNIAGIADFNNLTIATGSTVVPSAGCYIKINGALTKTGSLYADITDNTFEYSGNSAQAVIEPDNGYRDLIFSGSGDKTFAATIHLSADFENNCSGTVAAADFVWEPETNEVDMEMIGGTYSTTFNSLTLNTNSGLELEQNVTVSGTLTFTGEKITLNNYDLTMGIGGTISGSSSSKYVVTNGTGALKQRVTNNATEVTYPVGLAAKYLPVKLQLTAGSTTDYLSARVQDGLYTLYDATDVPVGSLITNRAVNKTWYISETEAGGTTATVTVQWNAADETSGFTRNACNLARYTGGTTGNWNYSVSSAASGADPYTQSLGGITTFSPFGIFSQTISCSLAGTTFCAGASLSVSYSAGGSWNSGNDFIAQLSDASGSFAAPVTIGTTTSQVSGSISATLPSNAVDGSRYRIRVVSTNPSGTGDNNGADLTINQLRGISGSIAYYNADYTPLTTGITVKLYQSNSQVGTDYTVTGGTYSFSGLCPGDYELRVTSTKSTDGAINTTDAALVNYWSAHPYQIEKVRFYAGDVTGDPYFISSIDAQRIQFNFVNGTPFDKGLAWTFWKAGETISSNSDPTGAYPSVTLSIGSNASADMYGLCTGDFNLSFNPDLTKSASATLDLIYAGNRQVGSNQEFDLPVRMVNPSSVGAVSLILNFPAELVEVQDVQMNNAGGRLDWAVKGNELRIGWNSQNPIYLVADAELLILKLRTKEAFTQGSTIRLTIASDPLNELADENFEVIGNALLSVDVIGASAVGIEEQPVTGGLALGSYPNPFTSFTNITYTLPSDGRVTLEISSMLGNKVATLLNEVQSAGSHLVQFDTYDLKPGIYTATMKLTAHGDVRVQTIKIVRAW